MIVHDGITAPFETRVRIPLSPPIYYTRMFMASDNRGWISIKDLKFRRFADDEHQRFDAFGFDPHNHSIRLTNKTRSEIYEFIDEGDFTLTHYRESDVDFPDDYQYIEQHDYGSLV